MRNAPGSTSFRIPVYSGRVLLCLTRDAYQTALERLDEEPDDRLKEYDGALQEIFEGKKTHRKVWLLGWFDGEPATLIHELCHTTFRILRHADVGISQTNDEAYAYLLDALYSKCIHAAKRITDKAMCANAQTQQ